MNIFQMENFFANSSFFFLFLSMISYWVQIAFDIQKWNIGKITMTIANFCLLSLLILRWKESGHFPLSNLYESLMFLAWSLSTFHIFLEKIESGEQSSETKFLNFFQNKTNEKTFENNNSGKKFFKKRFFIGAFTSPTALFINAFANFRLPLEMQQSSPLVPALQSNWLMMHVTVMILSYSALICGSLLAIAFLIVTKNLEFDLNSEKSLKENIQAPVGVPQTASLPQKKKILSDQNFAFFMDSTNIGDTIEIDSHKTDWKETFQGKEVTSLQEFASFSENPFKTDSTIILQTPLQIKKKFAENLDNLSYRILGIAFPLLTIGILSGAVWANEAWGSYWSWDPKETWALATWLVFAIYLHLRISKGWRGKKPAVLASFGFVTVWVCFLGVNLLGEGLHSYGFLKDSF